MSRDIRRTKRGCFEECKWWKVDENHEPNNELTYKRQPDGVFYAREESPVRRDNNIVGGVFMMDRETTTLFTPDDCTGMDNKCMVLYEGEYWHVVDVQKKKFRTNASEFLNDTSVSHDWYINLRRE